MVYDDELMSRRRIVVMISIRYYRKTFNLFMVEKGEKKKIKNE